MKTSIQSSLKKTTAQEIIEVAEKFLGKFGLTDFQVAPICKELNISPSIVNYHFNGRDELIAQTAFSAYDKYVKNSWTVASSFAPDCEKAFSAWIHNQVKWASENPGIASCINFPTISGPLSQIMIKNLGQEFANTGSISLLNLASLVRNIRDQKWSNEIISPEEVIGNNELMLAVAKFGWTTLGISTWVAGRHLPSSTIPQTKELLPYAIEAAINDMINLAKKLPK